MEKIKTETAAATAAPETEETVVVIMGDGPAPEALRKAFPNAKFIDTSEPADPTPPTEKEPEGLAKLRANILDAMVKMDVKTPAAPTPDQMEGAIRPVARAKFASVANEYGLAFTEEEHEALFKLVRVFCPAVAVESAHVACRAFLGDWRR